MKHKFKAALFKIKAFIHWRNGFAYWLSLGLLFTLLFVFHPNFLTVVQFISDFPDGCLLPYVCWLLAMYCFGTLGGCGSSK